MGERVCSERWQPEAPTYLGEDRMDMQFAAKKISRFTSKPDEPDWKSAKRLARYLKDNKRVVVEHNRVATIIFFGVKRSGISKSFALGRVDCDVMLSTAL